MRLVHRSSSNLQGQKGAVLIEYALMLPLIVLIFLAIINLGLVVHEHQVLQNAAREGARFSALPRNYVDPVLNPTGSLAEIKNRVVQYAALENVTITPDDVEVNQQFDIAAGAMTLHGSEVTITHERSLLLPGAGLLPYGGLTLSARAVFRNLHVN